MKKSDIDAIVIHCSATPEGLPVTLEDIDRMHKAKGWSGVGYNYVIELDGKIRKGRTIDRPGAHANTEGLSGKPYNYHSIGICYVGGLEATLNEEGKIIAKRDSRGKKIAKDTRTPEQKKALVKLVYDLIDEYPNIKEVIGHRDTSPDKNGDGFINRYEWIKDCPCFEVRGEFPMSICKPKKQ